MVKSQYIFVTKLFYLFLAQDLLKLSMYLVDCGWLIATPWPGAHQALLSMEIFQARILEWVAMLSSRGSSQPWPNWIPISSTILLRLSSSVIQKVAQWYHCLSLLKISPECKIYTKLRAIIVKTNKLQVIILLYWIPILGLEEKFKIMWNSVK